MSIQLTAPTREKCTFNFYFKVCRSLFAYEYLYTTIVGSSAQLVLEKLGSFLLFTWSAGSWLQGALVNLDTIFRRQTAGSVPSWTRANERPFRQSAFSRLAFVVDDTEVYLNTGSVEKLVTDGTLALISTLGLETLSRIARLGVVAAFLNVHTRSTGRSSSYQEACVTEARKTMTAV